MASFGLLSSAFYYVAKHQAYWPPLAVSALKWREWGGWELYTLDGKRHAVQLLPNSYSSAMISILNFRSLKARRFTVVLTPDLLPTEKARHLKRRLNILH
nr:hypothetical protein [Thiolinea disciformis]